ncbi:DUF1330 domain-containing protein [Tsukamurella paurometabola]|uniref:DUF1330 domain-containing protein n=1 Tax=Tsukamurella paurometabola TaxID=2061 RepID=UPI00201646BE|nr:DUF1330 domain-containing protein [Tsukamurella paurometabola]
MVSDSLDKPRTVAKSHLHSPGSVASDAARCRRRPSLPDLRRHRGQGLLGQQLPRDQRHREAGRLQRAGRPSGRGRGRAPAVARRAGRRLRGIAERTIVIEFDSFEQAVAARESEAYQEALAALGDGVERDFRIVEGVD